MAKPRHVRGLQAATLEPSGPFPSNRRLRGSAAEGIRYQRKVQDELSALDGYGTIHNEPWIRYTDTYGTHWCQPDAVLETYNLVLVTEVKLSLRRFKTAKAQLQSLYRPVLAKIFSKPVVTLIAFKHWTSDVEPDAFLPVDHPKNLLSDRITPHGQLRGWHYM